MDPSVRGEGEAQDQHGGGRGQDQLGLVRSEDRPLVGQGRHHGLECPEDGSQRQGDQHQEEEHRPELRAGDPGDDFRVDDESQSRPRGEDLLHLLVGDPGHVSQDGENYKAREETCDRVADGDDDGVPVTVPLELVVRGESDDTAAS